jgi:ferritin-like metal-binding protein YciE
MKTLENLFVDQLKDLLNAEKQLVRAIPKMMKAASSEELQSALKHHLDQTKEHVDRLEKVFRAAGKTAIGKKCEAMTGLIQEGEEMVDKKADPDVRDAAIIASAQKIEHYEIATYGTLRTFAQTLGYKDAARLLEETL